MSEEENQYIQQRRAKLAEYRALGINPFPRGMKPTHTARDILTTYESHDGDALTKVTQNFSVAGRIVFHRAFGKAAFLKLRDRSGEIQIYIQHQAVGDELFKFYKMLDVGDFLLAEGTLFRTKTGELSLHVTGFRLTSKALQLLPEKWHGLADVEQRYRQRYVDLIANPKVKEIFRARSQTVQAIRDFLIARDFLEVETPMMHPIPGGAAAKPFITHHNKLDMDLYLRIAPELYLKRLVVGGLERVFEINRNFRNEGISIQHNPEFTMLEFYQAYGTHEELMELTEQMFADVATKVLGKTTVTYQGTEINLAPPYRKLTMKEALVEVGGCDPAILTDKKKAVAYAAKLGDTLKTKNEGLGAILTEIFELTCEKKLMQPTFIHGYPVEVSPLARRSDTDPEIADRFELYIYGREIANAFTELNDPEDQAARFHAQAEALFKGDDEAMHYDDDYVTALEYGLPPTAGEGIGIDRLVMLLTDAPSIRDVILFPQLRKKE
ncbi:MAG: lysine--tRNA ligase [Deltaproteobacteria bacterium]|nr:lysine--tRNA ligase [Deltaproteobacteria bacterium]